MKIVNFTLIGLGLLLLGIAARGHWQQGWFSDQDYYLIFSAIVVIGIRWLPAVLKINLVLIICLLGAVEMGARWFSSTAKQGLDEKSLNDDSQRPFRTTDKVMGYRATANNGTTHSKNIDDQAIFNVHYATDKYARRITPQVTSGCRDKHLLFFGGSNTFGFGVNEEDTIPAQTAKIAPQYRVYNYGYQGYGPQHTLARLAETAIETEFSEPSGQAIFLFIDDHIKRVTNTMRSRWGHRSPYYQLSADGGVVRNGNFNTAHPLRYKIYHDLLLSSEALALLGIDIPMTVSSDDIHLTAMVIDAAAKAYKAKFPNGEFSVVLLPAGRTGPGDQLAAELEQLNIPIFNYQDRASEEFRIHPKFEPHSSVVANQFTARWIVEDLRLATACNDRLSNDSN